MARSSMHTAAWNKVHLRKMRTTAYDVNVIAHTTSAAVMVVVVSGENRSQVLRAMGILRMTARPNVSSCASRFARVRVSTLRSRPRMMSLSAKVELGFTALKVPQHLRIGNYQSRKSRAPVANRRPSERRIYKENQCRLIRKQFE